MIRGAFGAMLLATMACAPLPPQEAAEPPVRAHGAGACNAKAAQGLIGRAALGELGAEALRLTGARTLRWIPPGAMVTMDYREDRLNIETDANSRVTRVRCG